MVQLTPYQAIPEPKVYGKPDPISVGTDQSTLGASLTGTAGVLDAGIKAVDSINKNNIDQMLFEEINLKRQESTNAGAALIADTTQNPSNVPTDPSQAYRNLPHAVGQADRRMGLITQANKMGKLEDTQYYGEMQEINQRVSSLYPGYARYIQDRSSHWLGTNAANAQRSAIVSTLQQMAAGAKSDAEKWSNEMERDRKFFFKADGSFDEQGFAEALNTTDPIERNRIRVRIGRQQATEHGVTVRNNQIDLEDKERKITATRANQHFREIADLEMANYAQNAKFNFTNPVTGKTQSMTMGQINEVLARARQQGGRGVDPTMLAQLGMIAEQFQLGMDAKLRSIEATTRINGRPISTIANPDDMAKTRDYYLNTYFAGITGQIGKGNMSFATNMLMTAAGRVELASFRALENATLQEFAIISNTIKGEAAAAVINHRLSRGGPQLNEDVNNYISRLRMQQIAASNNFGSLQTSLDMYNMANNPPGGVLTPEQERDRAMFLNNSINDVKELLLQKETAVKSPELAAKAALVISNPQSTEFITKFDKNQQMQVLSTVASPEVSAKVKELAKSQPELWTQYRDWVYYTFKRLHNTQIASIGQGVQDTFGTNLRFGENGQIIYDNPKSLQSMARTGTMSPSTTTVQAIQNINTGLATLKNVAELDGQKLTPEFLKQFGINLEYKEPATTPAGTKGKPTSKAPNGPGGSSGDLPLLTFLGMGTANAAEVNPSRIQRDTDLSMTTPNMFDHAFDSIVNQGVNEPLQERAVRIYRDLQQKERRNRPIPLPKSPLWWKSESPGGPQVASLSEEGSNNLDSYDTDTRRRLERTRSLEDVEPILKSLDPTFEPPKEKGTPIRPGTRNRQGNTLI